MIIAEEAFQQGATDFRSQLTRIMSGDPQVVYIVGYKELGQLLKQSVELGIKTQFLSTVLFEDPEILKVSGRAAEGVIYSARGYDITRKDYVMQNFVNTFRTKYNRDPDIFAGYSYDAMKILALAMERGGTTPDSIKNALYAIKNFPGVTGVTTFDANGDVIQAATVKTVKNGKFVYLEGVK